MTEKFDQYFNYIMESLQYPEAKGNDVQCYGGDINWKGKVVRMSPAKFLSLAARLDDIHVNKNGFDKLEQRIKDQLPTDPLVLTVDMATKRITGHEGRHRAKVCQKLGIEEVPVFIFTGSCYSRTPNWTPEQHKEVEDVGNFQPERY